MDRFQQAKEIVAGATNLARLKLNLADADVEEISRKRMSVCKACANYLPENNVCGKCGCFLAVKTRSMESSCIDRHWPAVKK